MKICPLCRKPIFKDPPKRMVMVGRPARGVMVHTSCLEKWRAEKEVGKKETDKLTIPKPELIIPGERRE